MRTLDAFRLAACLIIVAAPAVPVPAQSGNTRNDRPVVVNVALTLKRSGQRGRLESQVESMIVSGEFQQLRQQQTPVDLLNAFYQGLFDREPDSRGLQQYLRELERGRHAQVIMTLVQSEEFERRLAR